MNEWYLIIRRPGGLPCDVFDCGNGNDLLTLLGLKLPVVFILYGVPGNWLDLGWDVTFGTGIPDAYCRAIATMHPDLPTGVL